MKRICLTLLLSSGGLFAEKPNILFIAIDDLRPELGCYGADYIRSPAIDALAASGRVFRHHYVQAPHLRSLAFRPAHRPLRAHPRVAP